MTGKEKMLNRIRMYQFAALEAGMFLDTHPCNKDALDALKNYNMLCKKATQEYVEMYGPLEIRQTADDTEYFDWVKGPWPWEVDA